MHDPTRELVFKLIVGASACEISTADPNRKELAELLRSAAAELGKLSRLSEALACRLNNIVTSSSLHVVALTALLGVGGCNVTAPTPQAVTVDPISLSLSDAVVKPTPMPKPRPSVVFRERKPKPAEVEAPAIVVDNDLPRIHLGTPPDRGIDQAGDVTEE